MECEYTFCCGETRQQMTTLLRRQICKNSPRLSAFFMASFRFSPLMAMPCSSWSRKNRSLACSSLCLQLSNSRPSSSNMISGSSLLADENSKEPLFSPMVSLMSDPLPSFLPCVPGG